jgi:hypothetical protein
MMTGMSLLESFAAETNLWSRMSAMHWISGERTQPTITTFQWTGLLERKKRHIRAQSMEHHAAARHLFSARSHRRPQQQGSVLPCLLACLPAYLPISLPEITISQTPMCFSLRLPNPVWGGVCRPTFFLLVVGLHDGMVGEGRAIPSPVPDYFAVLLHPGISSVQFRQQITYVVV